MKHILKQIDEVLPRDVRILVGVSGGVDSMALLDLLQNSGRQFVISHINHGLREESGAEMSGLKYKFGLKGYRFECTEIPVAEYAERNKISTELAARTLRYEMFRYHMQLYNCGALALGHHQDDRVETFFFNLIRGAGINGLHPMTFWDPESKILRPFINTSKAEIISYAREGLLEWFEDHTNAEVEFERNWLRNTVIPELETRRPALKKVISRTMDHLEEVDDFISWSTDQYVGKMVPGNEFEIKAFLQQHPAVQKEFLRRLWIRVHGNIEGFSSRVIYEVLKWIPGAQGGSEVWFGKTHTLTRIKSSIAIKLNVAAE